MVITLSNLDIYAETGVIKKGCLVIGQGFIQQIYEEKIPDPSSKGKNIAFPDGCLLVPGFIDMHVHGADGSDVMDGTSAALATISKALAKEGTTHFLATTMTASLDAIETVLTVTKKFMDTSHRSPVGANVLGVHLEGPFLSPQKVGAQRADLIRNPSIDLIEKWQALVPDVIRLVTLAPELSGSLEAIQFLKSKNIIASMGHTDATYDEACAAIESGCSYVTHLFNAMRGIHQREPGVTTAALLSDKVMNELIADGHHLHPAIIKMTLRLKGFHNLVLVTDAMRAKCLKDGTYDLGGQAVYVQDNTARLKDGTLAGSVLTMNGALKNIIEFTNCSLEEALYLTSINPAKKLGIYDKTGSIAKHKRADLVVLDQQFNVLLTMNQGEIVFKNASVLHHLI